MSTNRPQIPAPIQREVRRRCGFGCVICGLPLYEYDHLLGWANVQRHEASEITLLCDQHHREKTSGLLPLDRVREANANPVNLQAGASKPYDLHFAGSTCEVVLGSNKLRAQASPERFITIPVSIDGIPVIAFCFLDSHLLLHLNLFDEYNRCVIQVKNNQLSYSVTPWDITLQGRNLVVRERQRSILVDITFDPPERVTIERARLLCNGVEVSVTPTQVIVTNNDTVLRGCTAFDCAAGLIIGEHSQPISAAFEVGDVRRYLGDRRAAQQWIDEVMLVD